MDDVHALTIKAGELMHRAACNLPVDWSDPELRAARLRNRIVTDLVWQAESLTGSDFGPVYEPVSEESTGTLLCRAEELLSQAGLGTVEGRFVRMLASLRDVIAELARDGDVDACRYVVSRRHRRHDAD